MQDPDLIPERPDLPREEADRVVAAMPRRRAHALFALLEAEREHRNVPTSYEVCLFDPEASSVVSTAAALRGARDYAIYVGRGLWMPSLKCHDLKYALEDRYLAETATEDDR